MSEHLYVTVSANVMNGDTETIDLTSDNEDDDYDDDPIIIKENESIDGDNDEKDDDDEDEDGDGDDGEDDDDDSVIEIIESSPAKCTNETKDVSKEYDHQMINKGIEETDDGPSSSKRCKTDDTINNDSIDDLFKKYIDTYRIHCPNDVLNEKDIQKITDIIEELKKEKSKCTLKEVTDSLSIYTEDINEETDKRRVLTHHRELMIELNRLKSISDKQMTSEDAKHLKKINKSIRMLQKQIMKLENTELSFDDMNNESSAFIMEEKLKKKLIQLWEKREMILNRSTKTGRSLTRPFKYSDTEFPDINELVEKEVNTYLKKMNSFKADTKKRFDVSIDYITIRKSLETLVNEKMLKVNFNVICEKIYKDIRNELSKRRNNELKEITETYESLDYLMPETSANEKNPEMIKVFAKNKFIADRNLSEVMEKFDNQFTEKHGETKDTPEDVPEWDKVLNDNEDFENLSEKDCDTEESQESQIDGDGDADDGRGDSGDESLQSNDHENSTIIEVKE